MFCRHVFGNISGGFRGSATARNIRSPDQELKIKFGTVAGCVDRPKKLKLGHVSRVTGQNVKNNPITT